jgi:COP9 signalosome complex subunit 1
MALNEVKQTSNTLKYNAIVTRLNECLAMNGKPVVTPDAAWIDATQKAVRAKTEKLEAELKTYKNNLIKESIRVCTLYIHTLRGRERGEIVHS